MTDEQALDNDLTLEAIVAVDDRPTHKVEIPEWGGVVTIRGLSLKQFQDVRKRALAAGGGKTPDEDVATLATLSEALVSPKVTVEQAQLLIDKSMSAVTKLMTAIADVSALGEEAVEQAEAGFPA